MANQAPAPNNPTADYRKYSKGPNFLGIVIASGVVILVLLIGFILFLRKDARKVDPQNPNPTPNSSLHLPAPPSARLQAVA